MSSLFVTIPVTLLAAGILLVLVIRSVRAGDFDDWEGPAARLHHDNDECPELDGNDLHIDP